MGLLLAEQLFDIISKEEDEQRAVLGVESAPSLRPDLTIQRLTVNLSGTMPMCPEELRERYAIMGSASEMIRFRSPLRPLLRDYTPAVFNEDSLELPVQRQGSQIYNKPRVFPLRLRPPGLLSCTLNALSFGGIIFHWPSQSMRLLLTRSSPLISLPLLS